MGLEPPTVPVVSEKIAWFLTWFNEVRTDRDYVAVGEHVVEKPLTAVTIAPYYELIGADAVMAKHEFFSIIRTLDRIWLSTLQKYKAERRKTKRPNTEGRT